VDLVSRFKNESHNPILIADYGHGVITNYVLDYLKSSDKYLAINVQSNAGNRGFNSLSKFFKADFFSANHGELQVEYRNRNLSLEVVIPKLMKDLCCSGALVTQGELGMKVFKENESHETPAFASKVKDRVGAGDSVFAIASLLNYVGAPTPIIGFVSNLVAAHEIQEVGHRNALTIGDMKKQIKAILA
jgi:bifunctional ADP-heptose synthase (sugar kinase/adenylyltransferase)